MHDLLKILEHAFSILDGLFKYTGTYNYMFYNNMCERNSHAYGTYWPSFQSPFLENMGEVLYNKGNQMIELFILMQLIQVLTPGSNLINFYEDQKEVGVRTSISHKLDMIRNFILKMEEKHMESLYCLMNINTERK